MTPGAPRAPSILLVASGSAVNAGLALADLRRRYPAAGITVLGRRDVVAFLDGALEDIATDSALPGAAERQRLSAGFDLKALLLTGEGQTLLKLYAFTVPARRMFCFSEGGGSFRWDMDDRLAIWNHLKWRLGGSAPGAVPSVTLRRNILVILLGRLVRTLADAVLTGVALFLLLWWHTRFWVERRRAKRGARTR